MTREIRIDPTRFKFTPAPPKERPALKHANLAAVDNFLEAAEAIEDDHWEIEDGDVGIRRSDYDWLIKAAKAVERAGK